MEDTMEVLPDVMYILMDPDKNGKTIYAIGYNYNSIKARSLLLIPGKDPIWM